MHTDPVGFDANFDVIAADEHRIAKISVPPSALSERLCGNDLALLELVEPVAAVIPAAVRLEARVAVDEPVTVVGYGADGTKDSGGVRRSRAVKVAAVGETKNDARTKSTATEWIADNGGCAGDSGSPAFDADGKVVGVMSRGAPKTCVNMVYTQVQREGGFGAWIQQAVLEAAERRREDPPSWAGPPRTPSEPDAGGEETDEPKADESGDGERAASSQDEAADTGSCSAAPSGASSSWFAWGTLALLLVGRRRRVTERG